MPEQGGISKTRIRLFVALVVGMLAIGTIAVLAAVSEDDPADDPSAGVREYLADAKAKNMPVLLFRSNAGATKGQPMLTPLAAPGQANPLKAPMNCDRVTFNATEGICLRRGSGVAAGYDARLFGANLRTQDKVGVKGIASRARVSPNGRWGSVTMFVAGHSYADAGTFSTATTLIDTRSGDDVGNLEDFQATRDGRIVTAVDRNYWGTTFARDGQTFYATLATGGKTYLVRGSVATRRMTTIHKNVECPSLSPDGTRIAYKKRVGGGSNPWRLTVLDLKTMQETALPGTHGLDDQAEWLDNDRILYEQGGDIRVVPSNGSAGPKVFRKDADSPAVIRWTQPPAAALSSKPA